MSLPAGFGVKSGRAIQEGASSSKQIPKVSVSQQVVKPPSPKKRGTDKRKNQELEVHTPKKSKLQEIPSGFPYEAPVTAAGDWFAKVADGYIEPSKFTNWQQRDGEQAAEACRRAAAELFFHLTCNPSDTEKLRASLDTAKEENAKLKKKLSEAEKDKTELEKFKNKAVKDISRLKSDADNLRVELNKTAQDLSNAGETVVSLEKKVEELEGQQAEASRLAYADGFRSYVTGFLAVDPDYDWSKFVPATRTWIEEFKVEQAQAIEERRLEIELEAASDSAKKFLEQPSPLEARPDDQDEARQVGQELQENQVPRIQSGGDIFQEPFTVETAEMTGSQPNIHDSSQDQV